MKTILPHLKDFRRQLVIGPFFKLLEAIMELFVPLVVAAIINEGIANSDTGYIYRMGAVLLLLGAVGLAFALICQYAAAVAATGFSANIRRALFSHINTLSYRELDQVSSNSLQTRLTQDVQQLETALAMLIRLGTRTPFIIIGAAIMAFTIDSRLSLIFVVIIPLVSLILYLVMSKALPFYTLRQQKLDTVSLITKENLEGARVVRALAKEDHENQRFLQASTQVTRTAVHVGNLAALLNPAIFVVLNTAILALLWLGGIQIDTGRLSQGAIIALLSYTTQISLSLVVLANLIVIFTRAAASAKRISQILNLSTSLVEEPFSGEAAAEGTPFIQFDQVSFKYSGSDKETLSSLTFDIYRGETIGIIGGTGAGKTTLVNVMARFYDATTGSIRLGGKDIRQYDFPTLRQIFGMVPQQAVLFAGTIVDNLTFGNPQAAQTEIETAVAISQAGDVITSKEGGYQAQVEQGGKNLSGGQRQRLTIARALVAKPEILILDDSSSALDYATDANLRKSLSSQEGLTTFIVSQRIASIKHTDRILVLEKGRLLAMGTHDELLGTSKVYQEIAASQQEL